MIIFGLGNPGLRYRATRHNAGYTFLDNFARYRKIKFRSQQGFRTAETKIAEHKVILVKPRCFMNDSGFAISTYLAKRQDEIMIVLDDINLPLGRIRLRKKGSDGGHLGLRSIINALGFSDFARLRIGVGRSDMAVIDHVLNRFTRSEAKILRKIIEKGIIGIERIFNQDFVKAQNYINAIDLVIKSEAQNTRP
jgi:PTH1 family peptidyl-tRNA hydrolase